MRFESDVSARMHGKKLTRVRCYASGLGGTACRAKCQVAMIARGPRDGEYTSMGFK